MFFIYHHLLVHRWSLFLNNHCISQAFSKSSFLYDYSTSHASESSFLYDYSTLRPLKVHSCMITVPHRSLKVHCCMITAPHRPLKVRSCMITAPHRPSAAVQQSESPGPCDGGTSAEDPGLPGVPGPVMQQHLLPPERSGLQRCCPGLWVHASPAPPRPQQQLHWDPAGVPAEKHHSPADLPASGRMRINGDGHDILVTFHSLRAFDWAGLEWKQFETVWPPVQGDHHRF